MCSFLCVREEEKVRERKGICECLYVCVRVCMFSFVLVCTCVCEFTSEGGLICICVHICVRMRMRVSL